jgi:eukaryotic-like serine/threonine-protein kinase
MTPERWEQIWSAYEHAVALVPGDRPRYLDETCTADPDLRKEVESLLRLEGRAGSAFLRTPAAELLQTTPEDSVPSRIGSRIGVYQILGELGRGGMGEVYRAARADGQYDKQVAIKLVRVGLDTSFLRERFRHERQILASLDHPNIARLHDGGTTEDGIPYLVMELIEGERIDDYCGAQRLSISQRLELFRQVCAAVQYAHQRLVIHRDIKPGNILVTNEGVPKLLDFGIAKILDPEGSAETTLARPMTPEYASPEQIRGETITTASDVYSLGVVLYKLLTGRSPYRASSDTPHELSRAIAETEPQRPSVAVLQVAIQPQSKESAPERGGLADDELPAKRSRQLRGDLDDIVLMALRKEPERRYASVQQFSEDISRHLNGLPVTATKDSWNYRTAKFVQRHRAGVAAIALAILMLAVGIDLILREVGVARAERQRADQRFGDVRKLANSLVFDVNDAMADTPGNTAARKILLDRAVEYLDKLAQDVNGNTDLQRELAFGYERLASVQGNSTESSVGQVSAADVSTRKSIALFETVAKANPANISDQLNLARVYRVMASADYFYPSARPELAKALAVTDSLMQRHGDDPKVLEERALELIERGGLDDLAGDRGLSVRSFRESLDLLHKIRLRAPDYPHIRQREAKFDVILGYELAATGSLEEAQEHIDRGISEYQELSAQSSNPDLLRETAAARIRQIYINLMRSQFSAADKILELNSQVLTHLASLDPVNGILREDIAGNVFDRGRMLLLMGQFGEGRAKIQEGITQYEKIKDTEAQLIDPALMYAWLGKAQFLLRSYPEALTSYQKALALSGKDVDVADARSLWIMLQVGFGDTLTKLGRYAEAAAAYERALQKIDLNVLRSHDNIPALYPAADAYSGMGDLAMALAGKASGPAERGRRRKEACDDYQKSADVWKVIPNANPFPSNYFPAGNPHEVETRLAQCKAAPNT